MTKDSLTADDAIEQPRALSRADETLGSFLKRHRQSQGKELEEIAQKTRIHASTLRAIEEDNPKALPADVFTRGFVKNYAQYLGLDPNEALAWYIEQNDGEARPTGKINVQEVLAGEAMAEERTFPFGRLIGFFIVVGALFFAVYLVLNFLDSTAPPVSVSMHEATPPPLVEPPSPLSVPLPAESGADPSLGMVATEQGGLPVTQGGVEVAAPPVSGPGKTGPDIKAAVSVPEKAGPEIQAQKVETPQEPGAQSKTVDGKPVILPRATKEKPVQVPAPQEVVKPAPVSAVSPPPSTVKAPGMNYVLEAKFTQETWLSVQVDKEKKKSGVYKPGDHLVWQAEKKISLFVGNAGGIILTLNGKKVPPLGKVMESTRVSFPAE
ncbi:helix-turn-helix domain-containing protein [Thiovibrio frasassiensis]|uniref:DUF4115 domain-containing protein n=1 Tax=Thiovibrio frasassiensis TaxID=2984131 RepID=A0A9X4RLR6_9BACT|nr:helix-turn-helix domain-containing protein [Thiovibrio frasassiensis]MDG4476376.1 DUF4115 domain-containing protein [Thiovibrio frasassiensis]